MAQRRIGIFGGSFNPPHLGHLSLARSALAEMQLDTLHWMPAGRPWQKSDVELADARHRSVMVALLVAGEPRFVLDERELARSGPSYTVDSVRELQAENPGAHLVLVIGRDQYARLHTWQSWRELLDLAELAVAAREGQPPEPGAELRAQPHRMRVLAMPRLDISATVIRAQLRAGQEIASLVGEDVARYIDRNHLYRGEEKRPE